MEEASIRNDTKTVHSTLDRIAPKDRPAAVMITNEDGSPCMDKAEESARWGRHVASVFQAQEVNEPLKPPPAYLHPVVQGGGVLPRLSSVLLQG